MVADDDREGPDCLPAALAHDPAFRVLTMDGVGWFDPYTGAIEPAPFGYQEVAEKHLLRTKPWRTHKPKLLSDLLFLRWHLYVRENAEMAPFLHIFKDAMWLNPFTGQWVEGISMRANQVTAQTIADIARVLSTCPEAQSGKMLERVKIETIAAIGPSPSGSNVIDVEDAPPPASNKAERVKTDFHNVKRAYLKMLVRPPRIDGYQMVVHYEPHSAIARDFYDFIQLDADRCLVLLGDFAGSGPGAALMVASTLHALRRIAGEHGDLVDIVATLNDDMRYDLFHDCRISLFAALLDTRHRTLACLSAGHHPGLLMNAGREATVQQIGSDGSALGTAVGARFRATLRPVSLQLEPGDIVMLYSDGLVKTAHAKQPSAGRLRIMSSCIANLAAPCAQLVKQVVENAKSDSKGPLAEDLTVVALRVK